MPNPIQTYTYISQVVPDNIEVRAFLDRERNIWVFGLWIFDINEPIVRYQAKTKLEAYNGFKILVANHSPK